MTSLLVILKHAPYGSLMSKLGLDLTIACSSFNQEVNILLMGDAGLQLHPDQAPEAVGFRSQIKTLASLYLYDIKSIYIESGAIAQSGLDPGKLDDEFKVVNEEEIKSLISHCKHIVGL